MIKSILKSRLLFVRRAEAACCNCRGDGNVTEGLVLDEPAAGLDPRGRDEILARIREYHQETKSTVLLVSHSMEDIAKNANSIIVMNRAECMMHASVKEVFEKAEELEKIGLDIPQITKVFISLNKLGYKVSPDIYTVEDARDEIMRCIKDGDVK